jgi:hypothetical protein
MVRVCARRPGWRWACRRADLAAQPVCSRAREAAWRRASSAPPTLRTARTARSGTAYRSPDSSRHRGHWSNCATPGVRAGEGWKAVAPERVQGAERPEPAPAAASGAQWPDALGATETTDDLSGPTCAGPRAGVDSCAGGGAGPRRGADADKPGKAAPFVGRAGKTKGLRLATSVPGVGGGGGWSGGTSFRTHSRSGARAGWNGAETDATAARPPNPPGGTAGWAGPYLRSSSPRLGPHPSKGAMRGGIVGRSGISKCWGPAGCTPS